jgi:hypothetical protein
LLARNTVPCTHACTHASRPDRCAGGWQLIVAPRLAKLRPEDAAQPLTPEAADRVVDDIVYLINRDAAAFWARTTGAPASELARRRVPLATARSFVHSLFMVFPETQDR